MMTFVGHSHMVCALNAAQAAGLPFQAISLKLTKHPQDLAGLDRSRLIEDIGKPDFTETTKALIAGSDGPIFSFISGIKHVTLGWWSLEHPDQRPFDVVMPDAEDRPLQEGAEVVPYDAMREEMRYEFRSRIRLLERLTRISDHPIYHFAPPPPVPGRWFATRRLTEDGKVRTGPTNDHVRWKLWRVVIDVWREETERLGVHFVDTPNGAVDANGFLRDELVRNMTHGNEAFGELVLDQIRSLR